MQKYFPKVKNIFENNLPIFSICFFSSNIIINTSHLSYLNPQFSCKSLCPLKHNKLDDKTGELEITDNVFWSQSYKTDLVLKRSNLSTSLRPNQSTVKPVYNDQPWDPN